MQIIGLHKNIYKAASISLSTEITLINGGITLWTAKESLIKFHGKSMLQHNKELPLEFISHKNNIYRFCNEKRTIEVYTEILPEYIIAMTLPA